MKEKILRNIRCFIIPFILGMGFIILEMAVNSLFCYSLKADAIDLILSVPFTLVIILISRDLRACGTFVFTVCLIPLAYGLFVCLTQPNVFLDDSSVIMGAFNWISITGTCVILRFFQKKHPIKNFPAFFKLSSIVFLLFYIYAFSFTLFFDIERTFMFQNQLRDINLLPFVKTIIPYITGTAHTNFYTPIINMMSNICLFVPIGFYLGIFSKKINIGWRVVLVIGIPVLVEVLQYVFACGTSDIDDVILNSLGGFIGIILFFGMEKGYRYYQKSSEAKLFVFK